VTFQQLLRPTAETDAIPPFVFTYFDPSTQEYQTVRSNPIPLPWKASAQAMLAPSPDFVATPPPAGIVPVEEMTDIYGLVPQEAVLELSPKTNWLWYLIAYIPALAVAVFLISKWWNHKQELSQVSKARSEALKAIHVDDDSNQFLRALGGFIEAHIPSDQHSPEIQKILQTRDELAFVPDPSASQLSKQDKQAMLKHVKAVMKQLPILILALLMSMTSLTSAEAADSSASSLYDQGEFSQAAKVFSENLKNPDQSVQQLAYNYFGLGNSLYRLDRPGEAALAYRRALAICPDFTEASKNLGFIERKEGAVLPRLNQTSSWMTSVSYSSFASIALIAGAVFAFLLLSLFVVKKRKFLISSGIVLTLIICVTALICRHLYPSLPENVEPGQLLVITQKTPAFQAADKSSKSVMNLPASTPLIVKAKRGSWFYASTFSGTPAWIQAEHAQLLLPQE
jgi:tetratricopeptide (TPR) repeat protein